MRICLVSREMAPFTGGGIGTYASLMALALSQSGHEVHVLTQPFPDLRERGRTLRPEVSFHSVDLDPTGVPDVFSGFPMRWAYGVYLALQELHARFAFDFVEFPEYFGEGYFALRAKRTLGAFRECTLAVRLHTPSKDCWDLNAASRYTSECALLEHLERSSIQEADLVLSPTQSLLDRVGARQAICVPARVVQHAFDAKWAEELGEHDSDPDQRPEGGTILYFGRLERRKGVQLLIPALEQLLEAGVDARLHLIGGDTPTGPGEGSMRAYLERHAAARVPGRVRIEEGRSRERLADAIARSAVCCFPSLWENFPNVCLEAMALGRAIVASDEGGYAELLTHGKSGLLFRAGDVTSLANTLQVALEDDGLRARLGRHAKARLAEYCSPRVVVSLLEQVVGETRQANVDSREGARSLRSAGESGPAVSIVIPFYNLARTLPETLSSIWAQTFDDYEVILVDDGSTEPASVEFVAQLEREGRVRVVRKANGGLSSARNAGLRVARGRWVLPLDADDLIAPTFVEKMAKVMGEDPTLAYSTSLVRYFSTSAAEPNGGWAPWGLEPDVLVARNVAGCCTALIRRELIAEVGGYDEWLPSYEDWDFYCALAERGQRGTVVPEFLIHYRIRPDSLAHAMEPQRRHALRARLMEKHPALVNGAAMRLLLSESESLAERLEAVPFRHELANRLNDVVKRVPGLHRLARRVLAR